MNRCLFKGVVKRIHKGNGVKGAYVFLTMTPDGERKFVDVAVFGPPAEALGDLVEGATIEVRGRLDSKKDKRLSEKAGVDVWQAQIVVNEESGGSVSWQPPAGTRESEPF